MKDEIDASNPGYRIMPAVEWTPELERELDETRFIDGFNAFAKLCHEIAKSKGWWDGERSDSDCLLMMHTELSEAVEGLRTDAMDQHLPAYSSVTVELADLIIRLADYAYQRGLPVAPAAVEKCRFNETRAYRHGGKKL